MIPTDGMAIPRIKQGFLLFIRGIAMPSVGSFRLQGSSIAICGTRNPKRQRGWALYAAMIDDIGEAFALADASGYRMREYSA